MLQSQIYLYERHGSLLNSPMAGQNLKYENGEDGSERVTFENLLTYVGKQKDRDAFIRIFEYFAPRVKSYLMKGGISPETADELAQETMLTLWDKAESYDPSKAAASTWIFTIARNKKIDFFRKNRRAEPYPEDPLLTPDMPDAPDESLSQLQENEMLARALETLPEDQAEIIMKSYFEEKTHQDIADETGLPLGTVKSRIRLALEKLRHAMGGQNK